MKKMGRHTSYETGEICALQCMSGCRTTKAKWVGRCSGTTVMGRPWLQEQGRRIEHTNNPCSLTSKLI